MAKYKERDYWCYQKRDVAVPWAVHLTITRNDLHSPNITYSVSVFHDDIPQPHSASKYDIPLGGSNFLGIVHGLLAQHGIATTIDDETQIAQFYIDCISDF